MPPIGPYSHQPERAFWSRAVAMKHATEISGLFDGIPRLASAKFATAGSCFAQHMGRALKAHGLHYMDYEPAPPFLYAKAAYYDPPPPILDAKNLSCFGYGIYSCRYGNIYSARQLRQLFEEAFGRRRPQDAIWVKGERYYDALRPGVEPNGFGSAEELEAMRSSHLSRVRALFTDLDVFVFTLGLTETWVSARDGTAYPIAPGVMAGEYDPSEHRFENFRYNDVYEDLFGFIEGLRAVNPLAKLLLTVSPVPLAATATSNHVLLATTYSKSVLRSVAGDFAADFADVYYFPSFEVITGQPAHHMYYSPDLRTVCQAGVDEVMRHFFSDEVRLVEECVTVENFDESSYLASNPDVREAVAGGSFASARSHFELIGRYENRRQRRVASEAASPHPAPESLVGFEHCEESLLDTRIE